MYNFVKNDLNGGICNHVRIMISNTQKLYNKEITNLEREIADEETHLAMAKKRLEDLKTSQRLFEDQQKAKDNIIETAKQKLLEVYKQHHQRTDLISLTVYKTYSELTGISITELKTWLNNQTV